MIGGNFGKYQILSTIGKGSMGIVFLAKDPNGKEIALKLISSDHVDKQGDINVARLRFNREAKYAMELDHPNIVKTFDAGEIDNTLYLACELVQGGSLEDMISKGPIKELNTLKIARQVLKALTKINEYKLVHRDIKPGNVLIDGKGYIKLSDLGLLRSTSSDRTMLTQQDNVVGTPYYLAPEQIHSPEEVDIRCDLYALGVMLYECLTSKLPFQGEGLVEILKQHLYSPVPKIEEEEVRKEVFDFICELMAKKSSKRPSEPQKALNKVEKLISHYGSNISDVIPEFAMKRSCSTKLRIKELSVLGTIKNRMTQAKLVIKTTSGEKTLFIYGGNYLILGRNSSEKEPGVCLRLRPAKGNEQAIRQISGQHCKIFIHKQNTNFVDTNSTFGTVFDKQKLQANIPVEITGSHQVDIAKALNIAIHKIKFSGNTIYHINDEGSTEHKVPTVYIERPVNGTEHSYILLPGAVKLAITDDGRLIPSQEGIIEIVFINKTLWLHNPSKNQCYAIAPGKFIVDGTEIKVGPIHPDDQK